ncbi:MAG: redox-regulated ATPase YchF [Candidatus Woesearchaeota archaeon]|nr:redox-regulated ATPase YchF [Candidatus Woesearchaeota archaeon]
MLVGIVGKANVGKSTFFKALTLADVLIADYPFATIKPNHGVAFVKIDCVCGEFNAQCNPRMGMCMNKKRFVPVEVIDVAGLVPGAHEGKGMGNQFLDDLRQADAFIHVVDMSGSTNEKGEPIQPGSYDPAFDIKFLEIELDMWILSIIKKGWEKFARSIQQEKLNVIQALAKQLSGLRVTEVLVKDAIASLKLDSETPISWTEENLHQLAMLIRTRTKPMLIIANKMDIPAAHSNLERCRAQFPEYLIVPVSSECELALKEANNKKLINYLPGSSKFDVIGQLGDKQKNALDFVQKFLDKYGSTGVQEAIDTAVFQLLRYITVFPGGVGKLTDSQGRVLPDCFLMSPGTTAYEFAAKIHTDLATNFVAAIDVKTRRKIGRDTVLKNRDVVEILTSK